MCAHSFLVRRARVGAQRFRGKWCGFIAIATLVTGVNFAQAQDVQEAPIASPPEIQMFESSCEFTYSEPGTLREPEVEGNPMAAHLWVNNRGVLKKITIGDGQQQLELEASLPILATAISELDQTLIAATESELIIYSLAGEQQYTAPLPFSVDVQLPFLITANNSNSDIWVANGINIARFTNTLELGFTRTVNGDVVTSISLDNSRNSIWTAQNLVAARFNRLGNFTQLIDTAAPITDLIYDDDINELWIATDTDISSYAVGVLVNTIPATGVVALDLSEGALWAASATEALAFDKTGGSLLTTTPFADIADAVITDIAFDIRGGHLWLRAGDSIRHINANGLLVQSLDFFIEPPGSLEETCTPTGFTLFRDTLPPVITLIEPQDGELVFSGSLEVAGSISEQGRVRVNQVSTTVADDLTFSRTITLTEPGELTISVQAQDLEQNSITEQVIVNVDTNTDPVITSEPIITASVGQAYQYTVTATDAENDPLEFILAQAPAGMTINSTTGQIDWLPTATGSENIIVQVTDGQGGAAEQMFVIDVLEANSAPVITSTPILDAEIGVTYSYLVTAEDINNDVITYTLSSAPEGMVIDSQTGQITWLPVAGQEGNHPVLVQADDGRGGIAEQSYTLVINAAPRVISVPLTSAQIDSPYQYAAIATDINGDELSYHLTTSPLGMTINNDGLVEWLPVTTGEFNVVIVVTDSRGLSAEQDYNVTVDYSDDNLPPTLNNPGDIIVPLGEEISLTFSAHDPESQPTVLSIASLPLPENASFNTSTGEFTFAAKVDNIGSHTITISGSDGRFSVQESFTITVPEADTALPTNFSGRLLDAQSLTNGVELPIVNAKVEFLDTGVVTFSDSDGFFALTNIPVAAPAQQLVFAIDASSADLAPGGAEYASFREALTIIAHTSFIEQRPFSLPRVDANGRAQVNPVLTTRVENQDLGVTLVVPPNTALDEFGNTFVGELSVSEVPTELAPAAMPDGINPAFLITIQPAGVTFATPVPITFPNSDNLPPGMIVDIFSLDPDTGVFSSTAVGRVTSDGRYIETISGGIEQADWHYTSVTEVDSVDRTEEEDNDQPCAQESGSSTCLREGTLTNSFMLPHYRSLEQDRALSFTYRSKRVRSYPQGGGAVAPGPTPGFNINYRTEFVQGLGVSAANVIRSIKAEVSLKGLTSEGGVFINPVELQNLAADAGSDSTVSANVALGVDVGDLPTGIYNYEVGVTTNWLSGSSFTQRFDEGNDTIIVNEQNSQYGSGWLLDGVARLEIFAGKVLLVEPYGYHMIYRENTDINDPDTTFFHSPNGNFSSLELREGVYTLTDEYGNQTLFDSDGKQTGIIDRNGNVTSFAYNPDGFIETITDPVGLITTLSYANAKLASATDPAGRTTRFQYDSNGNLIAVNYPDGSEQQYQYAGSLMTHKTDERGFTTEYVYDDRGRNIEVILPDGNTRQIDYQASATLAAEGTGADENTPASLIDADDIFGKFTDARGNIKFKQ